MIEPGEKRRRCWLGMLGVFGVVLGADLALVAVAGTDIPFHDEWDVQGRWLLPALLDGGLRPGDLLRFHNEHRIFWTHLQTIALFQLNGQWDPLVELVVNGVWRALIAAGLMGWAGRGCSRLASLALALAMVVAFVPLNAWHVAVWGFESQVLFCLAMGLGAIALLAPASRTAGQTVAGLTIGLAALLAMAPAALVGVAVLAVATVRAIEHRRLSFREFWPALLLLGVASWSRAGGAAADALHPNSLSQGLAALGRALAWPHTSQPWAACVMNLPLAILFIRRILGRRAAVVGEDVVMAVGCWAVGIACAIAWARGGGDELSFGLPSRYVDFMVLLPLANAWCAVALARSDDGEWVRRARGAAVLWAAFVLIGWIGLSVENLRRVILPRALDPAAPVRLTRQFQLTSNPAIFSGQPRLLVPHPDPASVAAVLRDPRLEGKLPPSLQPERRPGPLSRLTRWLLRRNQ